MFGFSRITTKQLEGLCRRLSIALEAGIDVRTAVRREAERAHGLGAGRRLRAIFEAIEAGESFHAALAETHDYFPELFHAVVRVGEESGHLGEALGELADHYEGQLRLRRRFLAAIAWPVIELVIAVVVIGLLIWILGAIGQSTGHPVDVLGLGLVGNEGLLIYCLCVLGVVVVIFTIIHAIRRGLAWVKPIQRLSLKLPGIGRPLTTIALARLTWGLNLTFNAGMDPRQAVRLSLQSTQNAHFTDQIKPIQRMIGEGASLYDAFSYTGAFPTDFLDSLRAAEESGKVVEAMGRLSKQYQDQAEAALHVLTTMAGFLVWAIIAAIIILAIFRIFSFYVGTIREFLPT